MLKIRNPWKYILLFFITACTVTADEILFRDGPQEFAGRKYYWLAEWRLELTLPEDVRGGDRLEVLFGSKGERLRTLYFTWRGKTRSISHHGPERFEWIELPLNGLKGGETVALSGRGRENVAFLAGVRITGKSSDSRLGFKAVRIAGLPANNKHKAVWADAPKVEVNDQTRRLWDPVPENPDWIRAARSAGFAGRALDKVQRWLHEICLQIRDKRSGLFRPTGAVWNYCDSAADCYPFYVWAAYYTDLKILNTVMLDVLAAEQRLCNHVDRLPVRYNMDTQKKVVTNHDLMVFEASEYAKDGLTPIVEIVGGDSPWAERLQGIVDDLFKHARFETLYGRIPSKNIEVNGELLQMLPRLYSMTGHKKYLDWAHRLADYYLDPGKFVPTRLSDHGCEIIGGLGLLLAVDRKGTPEKFQEYEPKLRWMFDEILRRGTNSDGVIIGMLQPDQGPHDNIALRDGWGYDMIAFLDYDLATGSNRYLQAVRLPLTNLLKSRYERFNWDHPSRDNVADSVEGGIYLLHRVPVPEGFLWADREIATLLVDHTDPDRLWGVHKLEANTVRTVLIHTMLHTRNTILRPWRQGLKLGAAPSGNGICVYLASDEPYQGQLQFDIPRHRITMGFEHDWPRMNAVPEWYTVEPDQEHRYQVKNVDTGEVKTVTGLLLSKGLLVEVEPGKPLRLVVSAIQN